MTKRHLSATAGDSLTFAGGTPSSAWIVRGDTLLLGTGRERETCLVWRNDAATSTITLATGWRATYLRAFYNPVRRALRFCGDVFTLVFARPSDKR